jgi:hypothetical protein
VGYMQVTPPGEGIEFDLVMQHAWQMHTGERFVVLGSLANVVELYV